jgi:DNA-binding protein H-NS
MNIDELSLRELQDLQKRVAKAIDTYQDRMKRDALAELREKARVMGFTIEELLENKPMKTSRKSPDAKYRHPDNPELTWSGRGRKPLWFVSALESGISAEAMLIV